MAKARQYLLTMLVAVVVLSCVFYAYCDISGTILITTLLQASAGEESTTVYTTLFPSDVVQVLCRSNSTLVYDDPWWLQVTYVPPNSTAAPITGWVSDYNVNCGSVGNCEVPQC